MTQSSLGAPPLVAVCTPVYNGGEFLAETIHAVQDQTYPNLVHVLLDNCSTDMTAAVLASFTARSDLKVPVIVYRNERTLIMSENWSRVLTLAPGEAKYLRFLCADDSMRADAIAKVVPIAESDPEVAMVGTTHVQSTGKLQCDGLATDRSVFTGAEVARQYLRKEHAAISATHCLYRKDVVDGLSPLYVAEGAENVYCDMQGALRVLQGRKYGFVHERLGWTRMHEGTATSASQREERFLLDWLRYLDRFAPLYMSDAEINVCRRAHLRQYYRRLLLWRFDGHPRAVIDTHMAFLKERGFAPGLLDYATAFSEWAALAAVGRRDLAGAAAPLSRIATPPACKLHPANPA